jgi:hypothetical protein
LFEQLLVSGSKDRVASLSPAFDPIFEGLGILKTQFLVLACQTGSTVFIVSVAIEDDFLVQGKAPDLRF